MSPKIKYEKSRGMTPQEMIAALPQLALPVTPKIKLSKTIAGVHKAMKLLRVRTLGALEKKLCEVPKGQAVVLLDKGYTKIDCGKFDRVLCPIVEAQPDWRDENILYL